MRPWAYGLRRRGWGGGFGARQIYRHRGMTPLEYAEFEDHADLADLLRTRLPPPA